MLNPYRNFAGVKRRQEEVLRRMQDLGYIDRAALERALREPVEPRPPEEKFRAPHFCDWILSRVPAEERPRIAEIRTTLDAAMQAKVEALIRDGLSRLEKKGVTNAAAIVLDNATGDILAMAGSRDFFDAAYDGQVNGALALRQPGSTLKPITYGLGLEKGLTAASILEDGPTPFATPDGAFAPENYDESFHGPIRLRSALASSYNVPGRGRAASLGSGPALCQAARDGLRRTDPAARLLRRRPDPGQRRGDAARARPGLCRPGPRRRLPEREKPPRHGRQGRLGDRERSRARPAARLLGGSGLHHHRHSLGPGCPHSRLRVLLPAQPALRRGGQNRDVQGLSGQLDGRLYARRDGRVWAGDFTGKPMRSVSGITGAGPIFRDIIQLAAAARPAGPFVEPAGLVRTEICPISGLKPGPRCHGIIREVFVQGSEPQASCTLAHEQTARGGARSPTGVGARIPTAGLAILTPADGDVFKLDPVLRGEFQSIRLRVVLAEGFRPEAVEWWVNGEKAGQSGPPYVLSWKLRPGSFTIKARARNGAATVDSRPVRITVLR